MRLPITLILLLFISVSSAQDINIIPKPVEVKMGKGVFILNNSTVIIYNDNMDDNAANFFIDYLKKNYDIQLKKAKSAEKNFINVHTSHILSADKKEGYDLKINSTSIDITGQLFSGTFYGIQTLIQLLPTSKLNFQLSIPQVSVTDYPRFAYRGLHLDVCRHFMPVDFIKTYIDFIALHKMNYFHWHLTDDQGWRIEIKKYPLLTSVGGWRNGTIIGRYPGTGNDSLKYGGFYTQEQIKEVVAYAQKRYVTIIPEIEMPGHSSAAIAAYPQLSCFPNESTEHPKECAWYGDTTGKQVQQTWGVFEDVFCPSEYTFNFLQDVLNEVIQLFPSTYIHIGGDECPKEAWKRSAFCQQLIKDKGLKDEHGLQSYFIQRIENYLNNKGRKIIGWDEILEGGLAPNAAVMSWRGEEGGIDAAKQNHDVVMTPGNPVYFDHSQSENEDSVTIGGYNPIEKVYAYEPIPKELNIEQSKHILGAQANLWTEYIKNTTKVEYMLFPRLSALSEVLWSGKEKRNWSDFEKRLMVQFKRYDLWKVKYSKAYFSLKASVIPGIEIPLIRWKLETNLPTGKIFIKIQGAHDGMGDFRNYYEPLHIGGIMDKWGTPMVAMLYDTVSKKALSEIRQVFFFNKATGKKITLTNEASPSYPGDGAFTLVNGVQNEKGMSKSKEFLGFNGTDCEAVIDLGKTTSISNVIIHSLRQTSSWIWQPLAAEIFSSADGTAFSLAGSTDNFIPATTPGNGTMNIPFNPITTRFIKVKIHNHGIIPEGNAGAGNKAWLFVDEIEVN